MKKDSDVCCPEFIPGPWENKIITWDKKKFVKAKVFTLFYIPLNFGNIIKKLTTKVQTVNASMPDNLGLSEHTSKWNMNIYLAVDREIEGLENIELSGRFYSKVFEGSFKDTRNWCKLYEETAKEKELEVEKMYMWYTTCPKCAKKYGKNYVVIIGKIK